ncbi:MAG: hypothetical protein M1305_07180 [Candidatus Marsarchaeota archaeon]|nr:hypothetical protein [Candidatus Marsarchaeota archaeon]
MNQENEAVIWRLYLVREMVHDAFQSSGDVVAFARMKAVLVLDHSVELLLSTLLPRLNVSVARDWSLPKMLEELCLRKLELQSHRTPIERLRRLRDRVQHDGIVPSA